MWTVVHPINVVDGNVRTYWHHVMQMVLMISERVFWAESHISRTGRIVFVTPNATDLRIVIDEYGWIPLLGHPIAYTTHIPVATSDSILRTARTCDPLNTPNGKHAYCRGVLDALRIRVMDRLQLHVARPLRRVLTVVREPWMHNSRTRLIDNLHEVVANATLFALHNRMSVETTTMHGMSIRSQLKLFSTSAVIVLQRGSACANLIVARNDSDVVLLSSPDRWRPSYWIPPQYRLHYGVVYGGNFDRTVHVDIPSLHTALRHVYMRA